MILLWRLQWFCLGVALSIGCISWLSLQFGGLGHIPRFIELPGITLTTFLDHVPDFVAASKLWPNQLLEWLEGQLDNYQCPSGHEYRVEIIHHSPLIMRFRGFLAPGEALHLLKLA